MVGALGMLFVGVLYAWSILNVPFQKEFGWSVEELEQVRADKAAKRGGFETKILLKEVKEKR